MHTMFEEAGPHDCARGLIVPGGCAVVIDMKRDVRRETGSFILVESGIEEGAEVRGQLRGEVAEGKL